MFHKLFSLGIAAGIFIPNVVLAEQVIIQQRSANDTAEGNNNAVVSNIEQNSI